MTTKLRAQKIIRHELARAGYVAIASDANWWNKLSASQQKKYLSEHPNSAMGKKARQGVSAAISDHMANNSSKLHPHQDHVKYLRDIHDALKTVDDGIHKSSSGLAAKNYMRAYTLAKKGPPKVRVGMSHPLHISDTDAALKSARRYANLHRSHGTNAVDSSAITLGQADHLNAALSLHRGKTDSFADIVDNMDYDDKDALPQSLIKVRNTFRSHLRG